MNIKPRAEATPIGQKTRRERREDKKIMSGEELAGDEKGPNITKREPSENKAHLVLKIQICWQAMAIARNKHELFSPDP